MCEGMARSPWLDIFDILSFRPVPASSPLSLFPRYPPRSTKALHKVVEFHVLSRHNALLSRRPVPPLRSFSLASSYSSSPPRLPFPREMSRCVSSLYRFYFFSLSGCSKFAVTSGRRLRSNGFVALSHAKEKKKEGSPNQGEKRKKRKQRRCLCIKIVKTKN